MKIKIIISFFLFFITFTTFWNENNKFYNIDWYIWKDIIINNNFFPSLKVIFIKDLIKIYKEDKKNINIISLNMSDDNWDNFMNKYYSKDRNEWKEYFPVELFIIEDWKKIWKYNWEIKTKWNYSSNSLKVWFKVKFEDSLNNWFFKWKKVLAFRHLKYDRLWINEEVYFEAYKEIYKEIFEEENLYRKLKYYTVLINWKIYWYYLVLEDSDDSSFLENTWNDFDKKEDCIVKAKIYWADMFYKENDEETLSFYKIEKWDKEECGVKFLDLIKNIENKEYLKNNVDVEGVLLRSLYNYYSMNRDAFFQNYILFFQDNKWKILLRDWDMSFNYKIIKYYDKDIFLENWLTKSVFNNLDLIYPEKIEAIKKYDFTKNIQKKLYSSFFKYKDFILIDKLIWSNYLWKTSIYRSQRDYDYWSGMISETDYYNLFGREFREIYFSLNKITKLWF